MAFIYVASEGPNGPVKIGHAVNAVARRSALQTGNPRKLRLVGWWLMQDKNSAIEAERLLHAELDYRRVAGEWFDAPEWLAKNYINHFFAHSGVRLLARLA